MRQGWSRRTFLTALPAIAAAQVTPPEAKRFRDGATEFDLTRHTNPELGNSFLPPGHMRLTGRNNSLLYCSDRSGSLQPYRLDFKSGESRLLGAVDQLDRSTLSFGPDDRSAWCFSGRDLAYIGARSRTVYSIEPGWERAAGCGVTSDGAQMVFAESRDTNSRVRLAGISRADVVTVIERKDPITDVWPRPRRAAILYRIGNELWIVNTDDRQTRRLKTADGMLGPAQWSADGKTVLYLLFPNDKARLHELRECTPDTNEDKLVARTSQFVSFARNADATVFAGVSASKPSPHILLLLRVARRELTLCEHRAKSPADVTVVFSPNSQRLFYHSDLQGKSALFSIAVERFVEET